jgi:choline dehydrogenase-like flavoprotein
LIFHANATEFVVDDSAQSVNKVQVKTLKGRQGSVKAKYFCLCTGGIENARILLNSTSVMPNGVGNDKDLVGRFFMEHPRAQHPIVQLDGMDRLSQTFNEYDWKEGSFLLGMKTTQEFQEENKSLNSSFWFQSHYASASPLNSLRRSR